MPFFLTGWFWQFFFSNPQLHHFYEAAVWGNVVADLPLAVLAILGFLWHRGVMQEAHEKLDRLEKAHAAHVEHLARLVDLIDPEDDKNLQERLDGIEDALDLETPGGLRALLDHLSQNRP